MQVSGSIDHFHNDVTQFALFAHLRFLTKGVRVIHCVVEKGAVGVMPVSCCTANRTNRFKQNSGIGFYTIPAKQVSSFENALTDASTLFSYYSYIN